MSSLRHAAVKLFVVSFVCSLAGGQVWADGREYNESAWREYRSAKRQQVSDICDIWFAAYRPGSVGKTYVDLAGRYDGIDLMKCNPVLRKHVKRAERICTEIGELFGQGTMPDIKAVLASVKIGAGFESTSEVSSERGRRVLKLMLELSASEESVVRDLKFDE